MAETDSHSQTTGTKTENSTSNTEPNDSSENEDDIYEVEKIVGMTNSKGKTLFKVRWAGYSPSWDTWEPYENLESCKDMVDEYAKSHGKASEKSSSPGSAKSNEDSRSENDSDISKLSSKSRKSNYYYVDADGAEADTLKDKFWRNLEQGKINVFGNDMYSKVKSTGRSARPASFKEAFQGKEGSAVESEPKSTKKRKLSKSKERKKAEPKATQKKKAAAKNKKTGGKKAAATVTSKTVSSKTIIKEETPPTSKVKLQRTKAQTARKRISRMLEEESGSSKNRRRSVTDESDNEVDSESEVLESSANGKAISEASYGSTEEELQAESLQTGNYHHEVEESVDDSQTQLEELYDCDDLLSEDVESPKQEEKRIAKSDEENQAAKQKHCISSEQSQDIQHVQLELSKEEMSDPVLSVGFSENLYNFDEKKLVEDEAALLETETTSESIGDDGKPVKGDQKLASPCKVVVKRISSGSYKSMHGSVSSKDELHNEVNEEEDLAVETDANGNTKISVALTRGRTVEEEATTLGKKPYKKSVETKRKKGRGKKSRWAIEPEETKSKFEEETENTHRLPVAPAGIVPIGPPAGATQQAASLFRTKASVKLYDPTQTSSPNSSEQSNTPQTPDIRTPQTPVTPESIHGQQPHSVSSSFSDSQLAVIHPSPSCSLPSPVTPRTPSTSGMDDVLFDLDLDEIDLSTWDSVLPMELKLTEGLELSNAEFRQAVHTNKYDKVRQALNTRKKYDLEQPDSYGMTLAMVAAYFGYDDVLELLVLSGADINARQKNGMSSLMHACQQGHRCTVELLILMGAHINPHLSSGETALIKGVKKGNKHIVRLLLDHGANFAAQAQDNTALKFAKQLPNQNEIVDVLNSHIARVTSEFESQVQITLNNTAKIQCALFSMQCFSLCESERFHITFNHDLQPTRSGVGMLLFIAHSKFTPQEVKCRFYGPCAVTSAVLNGVTLSPLTEEANFVLSFSPLHHGRNDLDIHTVKAPKSKARLVVCAYKAQLTMPPD